MLSVRQTVLEVVCVCVHSHPVYAEQRAGLAEDSDDLLDLTMAHSLTDAAEHHQSSGLEGRVVLKCKPANTHTHTGSSLHFHVIRLGELKEERRGSYFCASSVHWSNHLQAGMSLIQA